MYHGDFIIQQRLNITGRGEVFTMSLYKNNMATDSRILYGDSFTDNGKWYKICGIDIDGGDVLGLQVKEIPARITPELVEDLLPGEIFGFGSNLSGNHSKGAAKTAMKWGAIYGQGIGLQGRTYGIPTKPKSVRQVLPLDKIAVYVHGYTEFARNNPQLTLLTTEIGCGLAKYRPKDIAPLFEDAVHIDNIRLPARFWHKLKPVRTGLF